MVFTTEIFYDLDDVSTWICLDIFYGDDFATWMFTDLDVFTISSIFFFFYYLDIYYWDVFPTWMCLRGCLLSNGRTPKTYVLENLRVGKPRGTNRAKNTT